MRILPNRTKSLFGNIPYIYQKKVMKWNYRKNFEDTKFLIIDDKDGQLCMCPLRKSIKTTIYEPNKILIEGGKLDIPINVPDTDKFVYINRTIMGIKDRVKNELLDTEYFIFNENYYESNNMEKYDYVAVCRSLDRDENRHITMQDKIEKIKSNVKQNGYLYLEYYIALDSDDYDTYPSNQYLRLNEIENYFDKKEWTIITNEVEVEKDMLTPFNRTSRNILIGYLDVRRKKTPEKREKKENIYIDYNNKKHCVSHKYIINGVLR